MQEKNNKPKIEAFDKEEYRLLAENIRSYQLCLCFEKNETDANGNPERETGTVVSVSIGQKTFLLTAGHNFAPGKSQHAIVFEAQRTNKPDNLKKYEIKRYVDHKLDIAVIEFDNKDQLVNPLPEKMIYSSPLPEWISNDKCGFSISGYLGKLAAILSLETPKKINCMPVLFNCGYLLPENCSDDISAGKNPDYHIIGKIQNTDSGWCVCEGEAPLKSRCENYELQLDDIGGVSGSGMWLSCKQSQSQSIIAPINYLIGIQNRGLESKPIVYGVKIVHFLNIIEKNYPELTDNIRELKCRVPSS